MNLMHTRIGAVMLASALLLTACSSTPASEPATSSVPQNPVTPTSSVSPWTVYQQSLLDSSFQAGDCFNGQQPEAIIKVDCAMTHKYEVYSVVDAAPDVASYDQLASYISDHYNTPVDSFDYYSGIEAGTSGINMLGADKDEPLWNEGFTSLIYYLTVPEGTNGNVKGL